MLRSAAFVSALCFPIMATAQCPSQENLQGGILIQYDDGATEVFTSNDDGTIRVIGSDNAGEAQNDWDLSIFGGVFEQSTFERTAGYWHPTSDLRFEYNFDYAAAVPLEIGDTGGGIQTLIEGDFTEPATYSYSVHDAGNIRIGDCDFRAFDIFNTYILPDSEFGAVQVTFLRDIGIGYVVSQKWPNDEGIKSAAISIAVVD